MTMSSCRDVVARHPSKYLRRRNDKLENLLSTGVNREAHQTRTPFHLCFSELGLDSSSLLANFQGLILGGIAAKFRDQKFDGELLTRSSRFTFYCTFGIPAGKPRKATPSK